MGVARSVKGRRLPPYTIPCTPSPRKFETRGEKMDKINQVTAAKHPVNA